MLRVVYLEYRYAELDEFYLVTTVQLVSLQNKKRTLIKTDSLGWADNTSHHVSNYQPFL
jgi:hypothetical protein